MVHEILDQGALGVRNGLFDCLQLLCDLEAGPARLDHLDHGTKVPFGAFQPGDQLGVGGVQRRSADRLTSSSPGRSGEATRPAQA